MKIQANSTRLRVSNAAIGAAGNIDDLPRFYSFGVTAQFVKQRPKMFQMVARDIDDHNQAQPMLAAPELPFQVPVDSNEDVEVRFGESKQRGVLGTSPSSLRHRPHGVSRKGPTQTRGNAFN
jgi:hypothetical protein